jgi:bifunctional N-acetylglucosamine-1-phosphate-uridyltransferase/glucosamine-1-phosphate-acetyltransferase GlmU-like protein
VKELYLVDAISATEAEAKIYTEFEGESNFSVVGVNQSKILKVLERE